MGSIGKLKKEACFPVQPQRRDPKHFWPDQAGELQSLKRILAPLEPLRQHVLTLQGIDNRIKGDGDGHMRGIGCLLTGIELFPGDVQGGSDTPAGWSMGISVDQHLKNRLQENPETQTRFGSLEFGVMVPDRADTWTRWSYAGPNQPMAPHPVTRTRCSTSFMVKPKTRPCLPVFLMTSVMTFEKSNPWSAQKTESCSNSILRWCDPSRKRSR